MSARLGSLILPDLRARIIAELIDLIPAYFGSSTCVLGEFIEVLVEQATGGNRLALPSRQMLRGVIQAWPPWAAIWSPILERPISPHPP